MEGTVSCQQRAVEGAARREGGKEAIRPQWVPGCAEQLLAKGTVGGQKRAVERAAQREGEGGGDDTLI